MPLPVKDVQDLEPGGSKTRLFKRQHFYCSSQSIITLHPFTITNVNCSPAITNVGGRPCVSLAGAGSATDGSNHCDAVASLMLVAGKQTRITFGVRSADATAHEWNVGLSTVTTTSQANISGGTPAANYALLYKTEASTAVRFGSRKGSGTAELATTSLTVADATWYDFEIVITMDGSIAGQGRIVVNVRTNGGAPVKILDTQQGSLPDTVVTALVWGFLEGDTGTDATVVSEVTIEQEY